MDEKLCSIGGNQANNWLGGEINLNQNGEKIATLAYGFTNFEYCVGASHDDEFQLQATNDDGVCITSLAVNNNQLLVGKDENQQSFWMNQKLPKCSNDQMTTSEITIKNGNIVSSECVDQNSEAEQYCIRVTSSQTYHCTFVGTVYACKFKIPISEVSGPKREGLMEDRPF